MWHFTPSCCSVFLPLRLPVVVTKSILKTHQHFCFLCFHSRKRFQCSRFLVPSRQRNHRKSIYCHGKYFAKESFLALAWIWTSAKSYYGNKTGNPKRAVSGSILPTGVANHSAGFGSSSPLMELVRWPISLVHVSKPLISPTAIDPYHAAANLDLKRGWTGIHNRPLRKIP